jgi:hypothetical protein
MKHRTSHPRPILAVYQNGRGVFKKGKATTVERSIAAAVRTLAEGHWKHARVTITNARGKQEAIVECSSHYISVDY